jgi:hypothetical protein
VTETKRCSKCGEEKPLTEFPRDVSRRDGLAPWCKSCRKEYQRRYYEENRARELKRVSEYREENREQVAEYKRRYCEENQDRLMEYRRGYRERNRGLVSDADRRYRRCVKNPTCPAVGGNGAEFVICTCEVCGKEFRRLKTSVDYDYVRRGSLPRFCSITCKGVAQRKGYKSPYARKIERIKKEVGA